MDQGFSILMLLFSAAILLYAALLGITKDYNLLPIRARTSVKPKDPKAYAFQLSKVIALVALSPAAGGLVGLWSVLPGFVVMILVFIVTLWRGTKIMEKVG